MQKSLIYTILSDDELLRISNRIKENEKYTSGEICLSIKENRNIFDATDIREIAEKEFLQLGIHKTEERTGILILIVLKEREFYILADEGINSQVEKTTWNKIRDNMAADFSKGNFSEGILRCVDSIGEILKQKFPVKPGDRNELSNRVYIR
jgi:uncharacterized membrane protein